MDNQTAIGLLTLCAVVTVMILLGGFLVIRVLRTSVFGIASMVLRSVTDPDVEEDEPGTRHVVKSQAAAHPAHRDLRAEAKSIDFDAAVASKKGEVVPSVRTNPVVPTVPPPLHADAFSATQPVTPPLERKRRRTTSNDEIDDLDDGEMFEGLLGE